MCEKFWTLPTSPKASGLRPLLPNEPCLHLPAAERTLTERYLLPVLPALETFFLAASNNRGQTPVFRSNPLALNLSRVQ